LTSIPMSMVAASRHEDYGESMFSHWLVILNGLAHGAAAGRGVSPKIRVA
jgi:hypothetical protein